MSVIYDALSHLLTDWSTMLVGVCFGLRVLVNYKSNYITKNP